MDDRRSEVTGQFFGSKVKAAAVCRGGVTAAVFYLSSASK